MRQSSFRNFLLLTTLIALFCPFLQAQSLPEDENPPIDTSFVEMYLDDNGLTAFDETGQIWFYDFDNQVFVIGEQEATGESPIDDIEQGITNEIPVKDRCTEKVYVKQSSRSVLVGYDEYVDGKIVTVGRVTIKGWVKGDVRSFKRVLVSSSGQVDGDIIAPEIIVKDGGIVKGDQIITDESFEIDDIVDSVSLGGLITLIVFMSIFVIFGLLFMAFDSSRYFSNFRECYESHKAKTTFGGFIFFLLMPVVLILVVITIIGVVLTPLVPLLYLLAAIGGMTLFCEKLGDIIFRLVLHTDIRNKFLKLLAGLAAYWGLWFITVLFMMSDSGALNGFGVFFLVLLIVSSFYPVFSGIGTAVFTRFGYRKYTSWKDVKKEAPPAPAPPPIPNHPNDNNR